MALGRPLQRGRQRGESSVGAVEVIQNPVPVGRDDDPAVAAHARNGGRSPRSNHSSIHSSPPPECVVRSLDDSLSIHDQSAPPHLPPRGLSPERAHSDSKNDGPVRTSFGPRPEAVGLRRTKTQGIDHRTIYRTNVALPNAGNQTDDTNPEYI